MIYLVYEKQDLIAETDNPEYLQALVKSHPTCSVRELGTDKPSAVPASKPVKKAH